MSRGIVAERLKNASHNSHVRVVTVGVGHLRGMNAAAKHAGLITNFNNESGSPIAIGEPDERLRQPRKQSPALQLDKKNSRSAVSPAIRV